MEADLEAVGPLFILFLVPFYLLAAITLTSFVKVTVVLLILRNALGLQQVPSTIIVMALSLFLSAFISATVFEQSLIGLSGQDLNITTIDDLIVTLRQAAAPFQEFIVSNVDPTHLEYFTDLAKRTWVNSNIPASPDNIFVQAPAFLISELTSGFQIGLLLYLPFIAIDLAITTILMALGMQQVQPTIISVPFKLVLFIFVDGWGKLIESLVLGYNNV